MAHSAHGFLPPDLADRRLAASLRPLARRVARVAIVALMAAAAVTIGLAVGRLGQGTRRVPTIAPTRQPVGQPVPLPPPGG